MVDLDSRCGAVFTYRELLECSNTWKQAAADQKPIDNLPREQSTFAALHALAVEILDPVAAEFGRPTITYGFGGPQLTRLIAAQIAPHLDQHAAHEQRAGQPICTRLGAAVDFLVDGVPSLQVARWIFEHRRFDRIYLYGDERPMHVSLGPDPARMVVELRRTPSGHQVPHRLRW
ncbi:MAG: hypothetical protein E6J90_15665 [Deltaproteobacteria bacterium]|nr:MAG: hypothetical protein E6J91_19840 [Deltaproteobacteria bacterium]TMQ20802.1 MAG: hypothetical protein E6J90_15665 [Deltaproteobacteria bacterium]